MFLKQNKTKQNNRMKFLFAPKSSSSSIPIPCPKDYVTVMMEQLPDSSHCKTVGTEEVKYRNFKCPNKDCTSKGKDGDAGVFSIPSNQGYTNVKKHLLNCHANGNEKLLQYLFDEKQSGERSIKDFYKVDECVSLEAAYLHRWIKLVVSKNVPISSISDKEWRSLFQPLCACDSCPRTPKIGKDTLKKVIFKMVEMIEEKIKEEMLAAGIGALLSDGWTKHGTHYLGIFATYNREVSFSALGDKRTKKKKQVRNEVVSSLLSCAPMQKKNDNEDHCEDDDDVDEETTAFDAETHVQHFENILREYFDVELKKWVVCHIADNASVNRKFSDLTGIPHIGCKNHKLNLEMNKMLEAMPELHDTIKLIHEMMGKIKGSTKKSAALRKLTFLVPTLYNKTRWSGKLYVLERFIRLRDMLIELRTGTDGEEFEDVITDEIISPVLRDRVAKWVKMLEDINQVTLLLQKRMITLAKAQSLLSNLEADIGLARNNANARLHSCMLDSIYINDHSNKLHCPVFHSGVIKIQKKITHSMTPQEKVVCAPLLLLNDDDLDTLEETDPVELSFAQRQKKRDIMEINSVNNEYRNVDFILGSNAEGERLWSKAKLVLEGRGKMTPYVLESILFLWYNNRLWDAYVVEKALQAVRLDEQEKRAVRRQVTENAALEEVMDDMNNMDSD